MTTPRGPRRYPLGGRLRAWREYRWMTQEQLADKAHLGRVAISKLEGGVTEAHMTTVQRLAAALEITPDELTRRMPPQAQDEGDTEAKIKGAA